jgi:hypothetical protein
LVALVAEEVVVFVLVVVEEEEEVNGGGSGSSSGGGGGRRRRCVLHMPKWDILQEILRLTHTRMICFPPLFSSALDFLTLHTNLRLHALQKKRARLAGDLSKIADFDVTRGFSRADEDSAQVRNFVCLFVYFLF